MVNHLPNGMLLVIMTIVLTAALWSPCAFASEESERIYDVQQAIDVAGAEWEAGATSVSGLTESERAGLGLSAGLKIPCGTPAAPPAIRMLQHQERFDWRDLGMMTPVRHQGSCGSCWSFSATGVIESKFLIDAGKTIDLSEQHLVSSCCTAGNCGGGWPDWVLDYAKNTGIPNEVCYPYTARDSGCDPCDGWEDVAYMIEDHVYIEPSTDAFKAGLVEYGPMAVVVNVPDDWYVYRSGVYSPVQDVGWANHAVVLTGWDDSDGCWFIKNSWGTGWGENGYARVKYGALERYNYAYAVTGIVDHGAAPNPITGWFKPVSAVASTKYREKYSALRAVDNQTNTYWFSEHCEENPAITFDLGEVRTIDAVRAMIFYKDVPMLVDIETSGDGINWDVVVTDFRILAGSVYIEIPFSSVSCRYVRLLPDGPRPFGTCTEVDVFCVAEAAIVPIETTITISYDNGTKDIITEDDVVSIMLSQNGTKVVEWWA